MDILNDLCRTCNIKKKKLINIHDINGSSKFIKSMLEYCLQTTLANESKYPNFICYDCLKQLEISYRFIKRYNLSQKEFEESYTCLQMCYGELKDDYKAENSTEADCDELRKCSMDTFGGSKIINIPQSSSSLINRTTIKLENSFKYETIPECLSQTGKTTEICSLCNKAFVTRKALNLHTKLSHKQKAAII